MAKRYNASYVVLKSPIEKKFICFESASNNPETLVKEVQKRHPKDDIMINYIRQAMVATSEAL